MDTDRAWEARRLLHGAVIAALESLSGPKDDGASTVCTSTHDVVASCDPRCFRLKNANHEDTNLCIHS